MLIQNELYITNTTIILIWLFFGGIFAIPIYTYAMRIGQNGISYVLLAILISPVFSFLLLLATGKCEEKQFEDKVKEREIDDIVSKRTLNTPAANSQNTDRYEQLERIGNLRDKGILTEVEFAVEKQKILNAENIVSVEDQLTAVYRLHNLIKDNKLKILDSNIVIIRQTLDEICSSKQAAIQLITDYEKVFHKDLSSR